MKKLILFLAVAMVAGFTRPSFAEDAGMKYAPNQPMDIVPHEDPGEALKARQDQADDLRDAGKQNQAGPQAPHQLLLQKELEGQIFPQALPPKSADAPKQSGAGQTDAKLAN